MLKTDQLFPRVTNQDQDLLKNDVGSMDCYFGTKASTWQGAQLGGDGSRPDLVFTLLLLYRPLEPWFNGTWPPGEIELVD